MPGGNRSGCYAVRLLAVRGELSAANSQQPNSVTAEYRRTFPNLIPQTTAPARASV